ncbi:MAG: hypothetical protein R2697_04140 [Ilumatobacteraceae bacterium]
MSDQHDRQPDDRMGLEAFDAVDAPDQWDDIIRRAAGAELGTTASAAPTGRRRSPATWFMAAAAVALVAVAAVAISVRSGGDESPAPATTPDDTMPTPDSAPTTVPTTEPPATTTEPTTIPTTEPPATTAPPASTVPVVPSDVVVTAWNPDCTERAGSGRVSGSIDPALAGFTTVDTAPTLDIVLPTIDTANGEYQPLVSTAVVPDGVAVGLFEYSADNESVITIEVVDLDGDIRWRRCLAGIGWLRVMIPAGQQLWLTPVMVRRSWSRSIHRCRGVAAVRHRWPDDRRCARRPAPGRRALGRRRDRRRSTRHHRSRHGQRDRHPVPGCRPRQVVRHGVTSWSPARAGS